MKSHVLTIVSLLAWLTAAPAAAQEGPTLYVVIGADAEPTAAALTTPAVRVTSADTDYDDPDAPDAFERTWVSTGGSFLVGTRPSAGGGLAPTWLGGFDLSFQLHPWFALGIRRLHAGMFGDDRYWSIGVSPFAELTIPVISEVQLYAQLGVGVDMRVRNQDFTAEDPSIAPFLGVGARFRLAPVFSIAVEGVAHVPVANGLAYGDSIAPNFAVTLQGGLALAFHFE
jgi:hypothetical protein